MSASETLRHALPLGTVEGRYDARFAPVVEAFLRNFTEHEEVGASVALTLGGETLVDLWGGVADQDSGKLWAHDTVSVVFSCTKGATALCAHILSSRGQLDIEAPVSELWPEFARSSGLNSPATARRRPRPA
ncbi:MAG: serine hydrolase domain-containing protein [Aliidongia sp.]